MLPNPSGLNAHETAASLAVAYRAAAVAAGVIGALTDRRDPSATDCCARRSACLEGAAAGAVRAEQ